MALVYDMRWIFSRRQAGTSRTAPPAHRGYTLQGMDALELHARLYDANRSYGDGRRWLAIGHHAIRIEGLDDDLCTTLENRWGRPLGPSKGEGGPPRRLGQPI